MAKGASINLAWLVTLLVLCLGLWGCGVVKAKPPRAVVADAIAQKVAQTQAILHRQLARSEPTTAPPQVSGVKITSYHWTSLGNQPVVEVAGTYRLKGGGLARSQQRQARPFNLYLTRGETQEQWVWVDPAP